MPKLFFDFDVGSSRFRDDEGFDLPDLDAGREEVLRTLAEIAKGTLPNGDQHSLTAHMRDTSGNCLYTATVTVEGKWHAHQPS